MEKPKPPPMRQEIRGCLMPWHRVITDANGDLRVVNWITGRTVPVDG